MYHYRSIFISDFHLGTKGAQTEKILDFLKHTHSEYLYLVGDIFDGWRLEKSWYWNQEHNDILQKLLRKARKGTKVVYIPGNHDEFAREFFGLQLGGITIMPLTIHESANGLSYLVLHGDEFDLSVRHAKWLAILGAGAYDFALRLNLWLNFMRRQFKLPYWSLAGYLKQRVKKAVQFVSDYETIAIQAAIGKETDGVICGHIHQASHTIIENIAYWNTGDWVENTTAVVEHFDGTMELLFWDKVKEMEMHFGDTLPQDSSRISVEV